MSTIARKAYPLEQTGERQGNAVQSSGQGANKDAGSAPLFGHQILNDDPLASARGIAAKSGINFKAGETRTLTHGLGRPWRGYFITRVYANGGVLQLNDVTQPPGESASKIRLYSYIDCTIDLAVF